MKTYTLSSNNTDIAFIVGKSPTDKKPALYIKEKGIYNKICFFQKEETAEVFIQKLAEFVEAEVS